MKKLLISLALAFLAWPVESEPVKTFLRTPNIKIRDGLSANLSSLGASCTPCSNGLLVSIEPSEAPAMNRYLATILNPNKPQIRFSAYTVQVNTDASDFSGTLDKVQTIQRGLDFVRADTIWLRRRLAYLCKDIPKSIQDNPLWKSVGEKFAPESLNLFEISYRLALVDRSTLSPGFARLKADWQKRLADHHAELSKHLKLCQDDRVRESVEDLLKLVERLQNRAIRFEEVKDLQGAKSVEYKTRTELAYTGNYNHNTHDYENFTGRDQLKTIAACFCSWKDGRNLEEMQRNVAGADSLLRLALEAMSSDLDELVFEPYIDWVREEVSETDELTFLGKQEVVMNDGLQLTAAINGTAYFPFRNEGNRELERKQARELVQSTALAPTNLVPVLLSIASNPELPPVFTTVSPGLNLTVKPTMAKGAKEADLEIELVNTIDAPYEDTERNNRIKPVSHVKHSTVKTHVSVETYDMFHLATQSLQSTYRGGPAWRIPILTDIPLIGKWLFTGPNRPVTKTQDVLILVNTQIIPRTVDLMSTDPGFPQP